MKASFLGWAAIAAVLSACGAGGDYGYSREYSPLGDEEDFMEQATPVTYEEVRRDPADYRNVTVGWFGIVTGVSDEGGTTTVALDHRTHRDRHLCRDETDGSCRVTISDRSGGPFSTLVALRPEDRDGEARLWVGSLVKVYGSPTGDFDADGGPMIQASYYRHWPRGTYVTTGAAGSMRR